ncbi:MAG: hypothetical protein ACM3X6_10380 [Patescibacteria group bacterium]
MPGGKGRTNPRKSDPSFVMTADDAERYAPPAGMAREAVLQEKGLHSEEAARETAGDAGAIGRRKRRGPARGGQES